MTQHSEKPLLGADNNALVALVSINVMVTILLGFFRVLYYLEGEPYEAYFSEVFKVATLIPDQILRQPWSLFTYNWTQEGFWLLLTNMIWLTAFGNTLQHLGANKHLFPIYFYSGVIAGIVYLIVGESIPLLGAQTSILALSLASAVLSPQYRFLAGIKGGGIPLWMITLLYIVLTGLSLKDAPWQQLVTILFGGMMGIVYAKLLTNQIDLGKWMHQLVHLLNNSYRPKS